MAGPAGSIPERGRIPLQLTGYGGAGWTATRAGLGLNGPLLCKTRRLAAELLGCLPDHPKSYVTPASRIVGLPPDPPKRRSEWYSSSGERFSQLLWLCWRWHSGVGFYRDSTGRRGTK